MNKKILHNKIIGIFCTIFIILYIFIFLQHLDILCTSKSIIGNITKIDKKNAVSYIEVSFYNRYSQTNEVSSIKIKNHYVDKLSLYINSNIEVLKSKYFNQTFIKAANNPNFGILIYDAIVFFLLICGVRVGFKKHKKLTN